MKKAKWFLTISLTVLILSSGAALAAGQLEVPETARTGGSAAITPLETLTRLNEVKSLLDNNSQLLALLKVDATTLGSQLQEGKTLGQIAAKYGVSEQQLVDFTSGQMAKVLDEGTQSGRISPERAEQLKAGMPDWTAAFISSPLPSVTRMSDIDLPKILNIDEQRLQQEFADGKTALDIAAERGISRQELIDAFTRAARTRIEDAVKNSVLSADKAQQLKANLLQQAERFLSQPQ